jgi:ribonucleotide reductase alpha subunit
MNSTAPHRPVAAGQDLREFPRVGEFLGYRCGKKAFCEWLGSVLRLMAVEAYSASATLAVEKGAFPAWDAEHYGKGSNTVFQLLPKWLKDKCLTNGLRNSHLLSIAPTGTIALTSDNVRNGPPILDAGCHRPAFCRPPPHAYA